MRHHSRFTCEETFRRMDDFLDRELGTQEVALVQRHLETCAACAAEYTFEGEVLRDLKSKLRRVQLPLDVRARLLRQIEHGRNDAGNATDDA